MSVKSIPRLNVEITLEQSQALYSVLPWGARKVLFHAIIDQVIAVFKECDIETKDKLIGAIMDNSVQVFIGAKCEST